MRISALSIVCLLCFSAAVSSGLAKALPVDLLQAFVGPHELHAAPPQGLFGLDSLGDVDEVTAQLLRSPIAVIVGHHIGLQIAIRRGRSVNRVGRLRHVTGGQGPQDAKDNVMALTFLEGFAQRFFNLLAVIWMDEAKEGPAIEPLDRPPKDLLEKGRG